MNQNKLIIKILDYIDNNIYVKISIEELSNIFFYNKDYIMRLFKKELGMTIIEYINKIRIYNSLDNLTNTSDSILKIAISHGFISQEYYSEIFKKIIGVNPYSYRKFSRFDRSMSQDIINLISNNLIELKYSIDKINKYKNNIPRETIKKLSLFK